jgi:hypothetical protein
MSEQEKNWPGPFEEDPKEVIAGFNRLLRARDSHPPGLLRDQATLEELRKIRAEK